MQILQKRQTGENELPASLTYGEIAIDKRGRLHTADAAGKVVNPLEPALEAVSSTQYDVKMLQLQEILEKKEPPMLGGFAEGFGDTKKQWTKSKCTVDTSAHQLKFDGDNGQTENKGFYSENSGLGTFTGSAVTAVMQCPEGAGSVEYVELVVGFFPYVAHEQSKISVAAYGRTSPSSGGVALSARIVSVNNYSVTVRVDKPETHPYYAFIVSNSAGYGYEGATGIGDFSHLPPDGSGKYPGVSGTIQKFTNATAPVDGYYTTKVIDLGVPVESGEVYLHYPALPAGASLTVKLGTDTKNHVALSPEGEERTVTLGGKTLKERKYLIPAYAKAVSGVSVRVDGHREKLSDVLAVNDICVCMR